MDIFSYFVGDYYNSPELILQWYKNLKENYCYDLDRQFVIYTDNCYIKNFEYFLNDIKVIIIKSNNDINYRKRLKFDLIFDYFNTYKHSNVFSFIQSNCICYKKIHSSELYCPNKITINESCWYEKNHTPFMTLYCNTKNSITYLTKPIEQSYFQAGHFVGDTNLIYSLAKWITENMKLDLSKKVYTKWHDETYFNYYFLKILTDKNKINIIRGDKYLSGIEDVGYIRALKKEKLFKSFVPLSQQLKTLSKPIIDIIKKSKQETCIIIGANPSIESKHLGNIIDNSTDFIIRLNRLPDKKYKNNYGEKTTFFIGCEGTLKNVNNKLIITDEQLKKISKNFIPIENKWLHTGFIAILIAMNLFKVIKIFGFGFDSTKEDENNVKFTHEYSMIGRENHHFINFEHKIIDQFVKESKVFRLENYYV